jgi:hypothetical protein
MQLQLHKVVGVAILLFVCFSIGINLALHGVVTSMMGTKATQLTRFVQEEVHNVEEGLGHIIGPGIEQAWKQTQVTPKHAAGSPTTTDFVLPTDLPQSDVGLDAGTSAVKISAPQSPVDSRQQAVIGRSVFFQSSMTSSAYKSASATVYETRKATGPISSYIRDGRKLPIVLLTCNRANLLRETIQNLRRVRRVTTEDVIVVQDGAMKEVEEVVKLNGFKLIQNTVGLRLRGGAKVDGASAIAQHYKFALSAAFDAAPDAPAIIIIEDDLLFSPDFYDYMHAAGPILEQDPTTLIVSAWNDNGFLGKVSDPFQLRRTEYFPGLGWLLPRELYKGLDFLFR